METEFDTFALLRCYLSDYAHTLSPDLTQKLSGWVRSRNLAGLATADKLADPALHGPEQYRVLRQIAAFVKKNVHFTNVAIADEACKASFLDAERRCAETNLRLDEFFSRDYDTESADVSTRWLIGRMETWISRTLGDIDTFLADLPSLVRVTSGATATRGRRDSLPHLKMRGRVECTAGAIPYIQGVAEALGFSPRYRLLNFNRVGTVPKNWKTSRTIACEPVGNVPIQLAFDAWAKKKLARKGIDLTDQSRNKKLAWEGSVTGSLATIDLSAASDTVSLNLIHLLFPKRWAEFLISLRAPFYRGQFGTGKYHKFSSMGNGTTFAVETLIFAAACASVQPKTYSVYGDDIIIDTDKAPAVIELLAFLGFTVNQDKSFLHGPFRESCGGDYVHGEDVTPFYIKEIRNNGDLCHVVNGLASICIPGGELCKQLAEIVFNYDLPVVPANNNTRSGVFVDIYNAYKLGLFRKSRRRRIACPIRADGPYSHLDPLWRQSSGGFYDDFQTLEFRGLTEVMKPTTIRDIRTYALYFIGARPYLEPAIERYIHPLRWIQRLKDPSEKTVVPTDVVKTKFKWVPWFPRTVHPHLPDNLSGWSDYIAAAVMRQ